MPTSVVAIGRYCVIDSVLAQRFAALSMTALGLPELPDVLSITATAPEAGQWQSVRSCFSSPGCSFEPALNSKPTLSCSYMVNLAGSASSGSTNITGTWQRNAAKYITTASMVDENRSANNATWPLSALQTVANFSVDC